ncbi:stage VI sporulation protein F [Brevibacillus sp. SYSU BS000544]|uniref:stage VI sporulation protein F n=1 Tax=Brevibacillus sp. SYSU BS000544 TaxID=3416443 RepID=UPI003CE4617A
MNNGFQKRLLDKLKGASPKQIDEGKLRSIAENVNKSDFQDETKLRQLLRTLATVSGNKMTPEKEEKIIQMFREKQIDPNNLGSLRKLIK